MECASHIPPLQHEPGDPAGSGLCHPALPHHRQRGADVSFGISLKEDCR